MCPCNLTSLLRWDKWRNYIRVWVCKYVYIILVPQISFANCMFRLYIVQQPFCAGDMSIYCISFFVLNIHIHYTYMYLLISGGALYINKRSPAPNSYLSFVYCVSFCYSGYKWENESDWVIFWYKVLNDFKKLLYYFMKKNKFTFDSII